MNCKTTQPGSLLFFSTCDIICILHIKADIRTVLILNEIRTQLDRKFQTGQRIFGGINDKIQPQTYDWTQKHFPSKQCSVRNVHSSATLPHSEKRFELLEMHSSYAFFSFLSRL